MKPGRDLLGFEITMRGLFEGRSDEVALIRMLDAHMGYVRELQGFHDKHSRSKCFQPLEPVMKGQSSGIVLSITPTRVSCRMWPTPEHYICDRPPESKVSRFNPEHVTKVSGQAAWNEWRTRMYQIGFDPVEWTPDEFRRAAS